MKIEELNNKMKKYLTGETDVRWTGSRYWNEKEVLFYENNYLKLVEIASSNKWLDKINHKFAKMWSIIFEFKNPFTSLENFKIFKKQYNINITPVYKGRNIGCLAIRIYNMKLEPDNDIVKAILDFIFDK